MARDWGRLGAAQRKRYLAAGRRGRTGESLDEQQVIDYYEAGGDLRTLRGHRPLAASWSAPRDLALKAEVGQLDERDDAALKKWRNSRAAKSWFPSSMPTDVAAALSQVTRPPRDWKSVVITPVTGTGRFRMTVALKRGAYPQTIILPDWDAVSYVGSMLNDESRTAGLGDAERKRLGKDWATAKGNDLHIAVSITGTETRAHPVRRRKVKVKRARKR